MLIEYSYDFAEQGGAIGTLSLPAKPSFADLEGDIIVCKAEIYVEEAVTSGGTPTITIGDGTDADGYFTDVYSLVGSANAVVRSGSVAGALVWDDTNDHDVSHYIGSADADKAVEMTIGSAALTAGKLRIFFHCYKL
jgi:hypothetical protein